MHEDNAERFPRRVEKYVFLHVLMFFCTSQINDVSMNDVKSTHIWEIASCPSLEFNDVTSCFNRKYRGPLGPRYFRQAWYLSQAEAPVNLQLGKTKLKRHAHQGLILPNVTTPELG